MLKANNHSNIKDAKSLYTLENFKSMMAKQREIVSENAKLRRRIEEMERNIERMQMSMAYSDKSQSEISFVTR